MAGGLVFVLGAFALGSATGSEDGEAATKPVPLEPDADARAVGTLGSAPAVPRLKPASRGGGGGGGGGGGFS